MKKTLLVVVAIALITVLTGCTFDDPGYMVVQSGNVTVENTVEVSGSVTLDAGTEVSTRPHDLEAIAKGESYYVKGWVDVDGAGTNTDFLWDIADSGKYAYARWNISGEVEFTLSLYEDVTTSNNGTPISVLNKSRTAANVSIVDAYLTPTLASGTLGDLSDGGLLVWSGKIGSGKDALVGIGNERPFLAKDNTKYWFRITKEAAGIGWLDYDFYWHEHE